MTVNTLNDDFNVRNGGLHVGMKGSEVEAAGVFLVHKECGGVSRFMNTVNLFKPKRSTKVLRYVTKNIIKQPRFSPFK